MEKIQKVQQLLQLQADYEKFMESVSEEELDMDELDCISAAGVHPQYQKFWEQYIRKRK